MIRMSRMTVEGFNRRALFDLRTSAGMTQEDLALMLNVSKTSISSWEVGRTSPQPRHLIQLAEILEVSRDDLLTEADPRRGLADRRMRAGLNQDEAAEASGLTITVLQTIERGVRLPTDEQAEALGRVYGISTAEIHETAQAFREQRRAQVRKRQQKGKDAS